MGGASKLANNLLFPSPPHHLRYSTSVRLRVNSIRVFDLEHGLVGDFRGDAYPTMLHGWRRGPLRLEAIGTHFGLVLTGETRLTVAQGTFVLQPGMYFAVPETFELEGGEGWIATRVGVRGLFQIGGPVETHGRLRYIDGCTDSLLVAPTLRGDPCLNLLHLPPRTIQSPHTHPSLRAGVVVSGRGRCVTEREVIPLEARNAFVIGADQVHHFETEGDSLRIVAYHPDSDWGPTHENHPMINRTILQ